MEKVKRVLPWIYMISQLFCLLQKSIKLVNMYGKVQSTNIDWDVTNTEFPLDPSHKYLFRKKMKLSFGNIVDTWQHGWIISKNDLHLPQSVLLCKSNFRILALGCLRRSNSFGNIFNLLDGWKWPRIISCIVSVVHFSILWTHPGRL